MKSNFWKQTSLLAAVAAMALTGTLVLGSGKIANARPGLSASREDESFRGRVLVGTWRVKVQLYNCQTNAPIGKQFASLLTFNDGGTLFGSTTNPVFAVGQRDNDQGVWEHDGHRTFEAKSAAFLNFTTPPSPPFNPGFQAGTQVLTQKIEFGSNPNEFTSEATVEFFDVDGTSYRKGCASATALRFE